MPRSKTEANGASREVSPYKNNKNNKNNKNLQKQQKQQKQCASL